MSDGFSRAQPRCSRPCARQLATQRSASNHGDPAFNYIPAYGGDPSRPLNRKQGEMLFGRIREQLT